MCAGASAVLSIAAATSAAPAVLPSVAAPRKVREHEEPWDGHDETRARCPKQTG